MEEVLSWRAYDRLWNLRYGSNCHPIGRLISAISLVMGLQSVLPTMEDVMTNNTCLVILKKQHTCPNCDAKIGFFYKQNLGFFTYSCRECGIHIYVGLLYRIAEIFIFVIASGVAIFYTTDDVISILLVIIGFFASIVIRVFAPLKIKPNQESEQG